MLHVFARHLMPVLTKIEQKMSILRSKQSDVEIPASLSCPDFLFENVQEYTNKTAVVSIDKRSLEN